MSKTADGGILPLSLICKNVSEHDFLCFIWGMMKRVFSIIIKLPTSMSFITIPPGIPEMFCQG